MMWRCLQVPHCVLIIPRWKSETLTDVLLQEAAGSWMSPSLRNQTEYYCCQDDFPSCFLYLIKWSHLSPSIWSGGWPYTSTWQLTWGQTMWVRNSWTWTWASLRMNIMKAAQTFLIFKGRTSFWALTSGSVIILMLTAAAYFKITICSSLRRKCDYWTNKISEAMKSLQLLQTATGAVILLYYGV